MSGRKQFDPDTAVEAAVKVFWERGYSAASIADLQRGMGLGRASLYATFGGKEQLFMQALDKYVATYGPPIREAFRMNDDDALAAIDAVFKAAMRRMSDPTLPRGCLAAQSAAEISVLEPASRAAVQQLIDFQVGTIRTALVNDVNAGRIHKGIDVDTLAVYITGVIHSLSIMHRTGTSPTTLNTVIRYAMDGLQQTCRPAPRKNAKLDPASQCTQST